MKMDFQVRAISAEETRSIRHVVLWPHKPNVESCVIDLDTDDHTHHLGAFDDQGKLVGVCSLFRQNSERFPEAITSDIHAVRLRVMGVLDEVRGQGAGAAIVHYACRWVATQGAEVLWCDAREVAIGFYRRMGFEFVSNFYQIEDIGPHRMMARKV